MKVIDLVQQTPEWHQWRAAGVTASEAAIVMNKSPYKTPHRLYAEKVGLLPEEDLSRNPAVRRGKMLEDVIRKRLAARTGMILVPMCGECDEHPAIRASFDAIDDQLEPVEIKAPGEKVFHDIEALGVDSEAYRLYWHQVQHQILVAGAQAGTLIFACETQGDGAFDVLEFRVERDEAFLAEYVPIALEFARRVREKIEPEKDPARDVWTPASKEEEAEWLALREEYRKAQDVVSAKKKELEDAEEASKRIAKKLIAKMSGFAVAEHGGIRVSRFAVRGTVDYKALLNDHCPDLPESEVDRYRKKGRIDAKITVQNVAAEAAKAA